eukprot:TRINITY_DN1281_c3_g2_i1.p1 TRINITY_DN1281_c3_g2~~TRINITY_DN1281_c3_g2_i1.p1  ORF type:complete len:415 (-),score=61.98 TRINITY_DN1281_c3_g2_i1:584-1828(-)
MISLIFIDIFYQHFSDFTHCGILSQQRLQTELPVFTHLRTFLVHFKCFKRIGYAHMYFQRQDNDRQRGPPYDAYSHRGGKRKGYFNEQRGGRGGWVQQRGVEGGQRPYKRQRGGGSGINMGNGRYGANARGRGGDRGNGKGGSRGNFRNWRRYTAGYFSSGMPPLGRTPIHAPNAPEYHPTPQPDTEVKTGLSKEKEEEREREIAELEALVNEGTSAGDDFMNRPISNGNIRQFIRVHGVPQDIDEIQNGGYIEIDQEQYALENDPELDPRIRDTLRQLRSCITELEEENYDLRERLREVDPQYALQEEDEPLQEHSEMDVEPQLNQVISRENEEHLERYDSSQHGEVIHHLQQQHEEIQQQQQQQHQQEQQQQQQQSSDGGSSNAASGLNEFQDESVGDEEEPRLEEQPQPIQ